MSIGVGRPIRKKDRPSAPRIFHETRHGRIVLGDSLEVLRALDAGSIDLVMTSPPFGLVRKKEYGNTEAHAYLDWFRPFAEQIHRVLKESGSLVLDIGGAWNRGTPTRSLYHYKLLIMLCEEFGFHLAQDFFWWNPARVPGPAEWVTVRRIRVKDAIDTVWWLSKTPWPKAGNRRVPQPYSKSMTNLLAKGCKAAKRPSGHNISRQFGIDNGAAIPPNLLAIPNTESNSAYLRYCRERGIKVHPARYPADLPEFFIRLLTNEGDVVFDPFGGSCVTGEVAERLQRRWTCCELIEEYLCGALGRFVEAHAGCSAQHQERADGYRISRPGLLWGSQSEPLDEDGGKTRKRKPAGAEEGSIAAAPKIKQFSSTPRSFTL